MAKEHTNLFGTLHGGAIATLADTLTTFVSIAEDRHMREGMSTNLSVDYLIAAKLGEPLIIECCSDKIGKYLSFASASFLNKRVRKPSHYILYKHWYRF